MDNKTVNQLIPVLYAVLVGCWTASAGATDYYLDNTNGNNSWTGTAETFIGGTSTVGPWQNFDRIKASSFIPGDKIHLRRGSKWSGELIGADTASTTIQNYGDAAAPLPVLEAMTDIENAYIENFNLDVYNPDPVNTRLDDFSGRWFEQLGSGSNNSILASADTDNIPGVSIELNHVSGSSPQLSNTSLIGIAANSELEYKFRIKVVNVNGGASLRIRTPNYSGSNEANWWYDETDNWGPANTPHMTFDGTDESWQEVTVPVITPSFISQPTLNFKSLSAGTKIYLDDFSLSTKWTPSATPEIYKRLMVTPSVSPPTRVQVNGIDIVSSNSLAELQSLPVNNPTHNGKWAWEANERIFYMYFDSLVSRDTANIRVNRTNNALVVISEPNIVVDGLRLENGGRGIIVAADDSTVRNCEVDNMLSSAMFVGRLNLRFEKINVSNNNVSNSGVGIYLKNIHDSIVDANTVTNIAIPLSSATDDETIGLQSGTNNIISNNILDIGSQGIGVWGSPTYPANSNIFKGNIISNMTGHGILLGGHNDAVANNLIHHNIIHSCGLQPGALEKAAGIRQNKNAGLAGPNIYAHNVLYNNKSSFAGESGNYNYTYGSGGSGVTAKFVFANNVSLNPSFRHLQLGRNNLAGTTVSNNIFYPEDLPSAPTPTYNPEDFLYSWNGSFRTLSEFEAATNEATNNVGEDPLFIDPLALDFHLQDQSPAIEVGTTQIPAGINNWQPLLGIPDIGVFEYGGADSDGDGLSDYDERCHDGDCAIYNPYDSAINPTGTDLNINLADSDGDGVNDGDEIAAGTDPLNSESGAATSAVSAPAMGFMTLFSLWFGLMLTGLRFSRITFK